MSEQTTENTIPKPAGTGTGQTVTMSLSDLNQVVQSAVADALRQKELEEKGETKRGNRIEITTEALKERLDRARATARKEIAELAGVKPDELETWVKSAKDAQAKLAEYESNQGPSDEDIAKANEELKKALKSAGIPDDRLDIVAGYFWGWLPEQKDVPDDPTAAFLEHLKSDSTKWLFNNPNNNQSDNAENNENNEPPKATTGNRTEEPAKGADVNTEEPDVRDPNKVPRDKFKQKLAELGIDI